MKMLILSRRPDLFSIRRLQEEAEKAGHTSVVFEPEQEDALKTDADVVIPRFGTWHFEEALAVLEKWERRKVPCLNGTTALRDSRNKWVSSLILREEGIPTPETQLAQKSELPKTYPYVVKMVESSKGEGVFLIRGPQNLLQLPLQPEWIVQEFIAEAEGKDLRIIVDREGVVAAMERHAASGDFRGNLAQGGSAKNVTLTNMEKGLAMTALKTHNLHFAGVDVVRSSRGPLVLEVNGCPGLEGIETTTGVNVAARLIAAAAGLRG